MQITPHPLVPIPDDETLIALHQQKGPEAVQQLLEAREERIRLSEDDPVHHGFMLPQQEMIEELLKNRTECWIYGGNRSGKSFTSARIVMKALLENPGTTIICWAQNEEASVEMQQPYLQAMLPTKLRGGRVKDSVANINWNDKSGFTGKKFVLPNGSKCLFKFYSQFIANPKVIEGFRLGCIPDKCQYLNVGTWLDEYYMDEALIKRLYRRCNDYDAKIITSFTPLDGYTPTVKTTLNGAKTLRTQYASLLKREMPYVIQPKKKSSAVVFFHTERNPFTNFKRLSDDLDGSSEEEIMTIAYGYPTKSITTNFPLFNEDVHVVKDLPTITKDTHTVYQVIDPSDARNFFCLWAAVDKVGRVTILREWPDRDTYGPWAEAGSGGTDGVKWKKGKASRKIGYSVLAESPMNSYPELFKEIEDKLGVEVFERIGDSRYMAAEHGEQDMFADFADKGMWVVPSWGGKEQDGLRKVEEWFSYDPNVPVDSTNRPRLTIHKSCGNLIDSIINYAPDEGKAYEALKDPIDCYDAETEILTKRGWLKFEDLSELDMVAAATENGRTEWQKPTEIIARQYKGEMICSDTTRLSFCVTPNHRMYVNAQSKKKTIRLAKDLKRQDTIICKTSGIPDAKVSEKTKAWFEFLGWYLGDGCASSNMSGKIQIPGRGYSVYISQSKEANPHKCQMIEDCLNKLCYKWSYRSGSYVISNKELWSKVINIGNRDNKRIPVECFSAAKCCIDAMLWGLQNSDGWTNKDGEMRYCSVSEGLANDVQALLILAGRGASTICKRDVEKMKPSTLKSGLIITPRKDQFWVSETKGLSKSLTNSKKENLIYRKPYNGMVYCVTVPSGLIWVRRQGKPMICGNCLRYLRTTNAGEGPEHYGPGALGTTKPTKGGY